MIPVWQPWPSFDRGPFANRLCHGWPQSRYQCGEVQEACPDRCQDPGRMGSHLAVLLLVKGCEVRGNVYRVAIEESVRRVLRLLHTTDQMNFRAAPLLTLPSI